MNKTNLSDYVVDLSEKQSDKIFYTAQRMFDNGMCLCDKCGEICSVDNKYCRSCRNEIVIFIKRRWPRA